MQFIPDLGTFAVRMREKVLHDCSGTKVSKKIRPRTFLSEKRLYLQK